MILTQRRSSQARRAGDANTHLKGAVETYLNREMCRGTMSSRPALDGRELGLEITPGRVARRTRGRALAKVLWTSAMIRVIGGHGWLLCNKFESNVPDSWEFRRHERS
jgi:hypothetical protein